MTASQRSSYTKRRKAIWEAMHPAPLKDRTIQALVGVVESLGGATCATQKATEHKDRPQNQQQFAAETAAITGESKSQINRHVARAEALGDDLDRLVGTSLDKGVEAGALIKLPVPERKELIERAVAGEKVTARPVSTAPHPQPADESPADFMQRYAFEMRLALDGAMCAPVGVDAQPWPPNRS